MILPFGDTEGRRKWMQVSAYSVNKNAGPCRPQLLLGVRGRSVAMKDPIYQFGNSPASFYASDVVAYVTANKLPTVPVVPRSVDGCGTGVDDPSVELEAVLDVDMEMAMNPQAKRIIVYQDGTDSFPVALAPTRKRDFVWRTLSYIIQPSRIAGSRRTRSMSSWFSRSQPEGRPIPRRFSSKLSIRTGMDPETFPWACLGRGSVSPDRLWVILALPWVDEEPLPLLRQFARGHPPRGADVMALPRLRPSRDQLSLGCQHRAQP
jgi:hypothetical protein